MISNLKEHAKNSLHSFFTICARDLDPTTNKGPTLVIAPHPDDESLGCGATIALLRSRGEQVRIVIVTDGAASGRSAIIGPDKLSATRRTETENAIEALGGKREDLVFLQFPDAHTHEQEAAVEAALAEQIRSFAPKQIFSPYGDDGHSDHRVTASAIGRLWEKGGISCPLYEYPIWFWSARALRHLAQPQKLKRLRRVTTKGFLEAKKAAISAHRSQYETPTDEAGWFTFPPGFLSRFLTPYELFFEKSPRNK